MKPKIITEKHLQQVESFATQHREKVSWITNMQAPKMGIGFEDCLYESQRTDNPFFLLTFINPEYPDLVVVVNFALDKMVHGMKIVDLQQMNDTFFSWKNLRSTEFQIHEFIDMGAYLDERVQPGLEYLPQLCNWLTVNFPKVQQYNELVNRACGANCITIVKALKSFFTVQDMGQVTWQDFSAMLWSESKANYPTELQMNGTKSEARKRAGNGYNEFLTLIHDIQQYEG